MLRRSGLFHAIALRLGLMSLWYREDLFEDEDESTAFERQFGRPLALPRT